MRSVTVVFAALWAAMAPVHAAEPITWSVKNNFGLFANAETEARFGKESAAYLACMKRTFSPGQCENLRTTFGLTQKPLRSVSIPRRCAMRLTCSGRPQTVKPIT
jgi:hypothetical protein